MVSGYRGSPGQAASAACQSQGFRSPACSRSVESAKISSMEASFASFPRLNTSPRRANRAAKSTSWVLTSRAIPAWVSRSRISSSRVTFSGSREAVGSSSNDLNEGYYVLMNFESKPEFPAELERVMKITEGVMRCLTTAVEA